MSTVKLVNKTIKKYAKYIPFTTLVAGFGIFAYSAVAHASSYSGADYIGRYIAPGSYEGARFEVSVNTTKTPRVFIKNSNNKTVDTFTYDKGYGETSAEPRAMTLRSSNSSNLSVTLDICKPTQLVYRFDKDIVTYKWTGDAGAATVEWPVGGDSLANLQTFVQWAEVLKQNAARGNVSSVKKDYFENLISKCGSSKNIDLTPMPNRLVKPQVKSDDAFATGWVNMLRDNPELKSVASSNMLLVLKDKSSGKIVQSHKFKVSSNGNFKTEPEWKDYNLTRKSYSLEIYKSGYGFTIDKNYLAWDGDRTVSSGSLSGIKEYLKLLQKNGQTVDDILQQDADNQTELAKVKRLKSLFFDSQGNLNNYNLQAMCYIDSWNKNSKSKLPTALAQSQGTLSGLIKPLDDVIIVDLSTGRGQVIGSSAKATKISVSSIDGSIKASIDGGSTDIIKVANDYYNCIRQDGTFSKSLDDIAAITVEPPTDDQTNKKAEGCQIQGAIGWILNPICDIAVKSTEKIGDFVVDALKIQPLTESGGGNTSGIYETWKVFRDLASAFMVLVFLIVIFAQVLPIEVDAYTVKKMMPKLVAAAIGIQISYFVCQIMVDISNVLGGGVTELIQSAIDRVPSIATSGSASNPITLVFAGVAGIAITLFFVGPVVMLLLAGLISIITMLVTIQARQIIIIFLVIGSPIAALAWTLPNTEQYAKKWGQNFIKLLMMYPLIAFILAGSQLAYYVMSSAFSLNPTQNGMSSIQQIMVNFIPVIAFFMIPATFKASGAIMGAISNAGFGKAKGLTGRARAGAGNQVKGWKDNFQRSRAISGADKSYGAFRRFGNRALSGAGLAGSFGMTKSARYNQAQKAEAGLHDKIKLISAELTEHGLNGDNKKLKQWLDNDGKGRDKAEQIAAMQMLGENGGVEELAQVYEAMEKKNGGKHNSEWSDEQRDIWQQGTVNSRQALAKALPYAVRPDHNRSIGKLDAEGITSLKGAAGAASTDADGNLKLNANGYGDSHIEKGLEEIAAVAGANVGDVVRGKKLDANDIAEAQTQQQKVLSSMVGIGQSTDRRGRIDGKNVKAFARAAKAGLLGDAVMTVPGEAEPMTAAQFAEKYITMETGQLKAVQEK